MPSLLARFRPHLLIAIVLASLATAVAQAPIAQDPAFHRFADPRAFAGVPNFWNVFSNLPFLLVGILGLDWLRRRPPGIEPVLRLAYRVLFLGVALVGFGSAFYHWRPDNQTLVWDRLPMTLAFMAFFTIVIGEHLRPALGRWLLWPLLTFGALSVAYWSVTEATGHGDLRPYAVVQFVPVLLIPLILLLYPRPGSAATWLLLAAYVAAKLLEQFDAQVFAALGAISGHSLKHVVAALGMAALLAGLHRRAGRAGFANP